MALLSGRRLGDKGYHSVPVTGIRDADEAQVLPLMNDECGNGWLLSQIQRPPVDSGQTLRMDHHRPNRLASGRPFPGQICQQVLYCPNGKTYPRIHKNVQSQHQVMPDGTKQYYIHGMNDHTNRACRALGTRLSVFQPAANVV